jgi:acid phosphatase type 7
MAISWVTTSDAATEIQYSDGSSKDLTLKASGYSTTYKFDYPDFAHYQSGVIHHVQIDGLKPETLYFYQIGDFTKGSTSGTLTFKTLPKVGSKQPVTFGVLGDLGQTTDSQSTLLHLIENRALAMILHAGDLSYADCDQPLWDSYGLMIEDLAKERYVTHSLHSVH